MNRNYLDALRERVVIFDGAMGTQLMDRNLSDADFGGKRYHGCNEALVLSRPDVVEEIHRSYLEAGADVVETDSFTASRLKLDEYELGERTLEVNRVAAQIARRACDAFEARDGRPRFVAGSLGPTGFLISSSDPALSKITYDQLRDVYGEQARALVEGGADLLVIETSQDLLEVKAAVAGIVREFDRGLTRIPIQAQVTLDVTGRMLLGTDIRAVRATLEALPIDVIGLNCSTGPVHMRDPVRYLAENARCFIAVIPNAGLPLMGPKGETIYPETPDEMAGELRSFVRDFGVNAVGGCCGTTPAHIRAIRAACADLPAAAREPAQEEFVASAITAISLEQNPRPLLVGERLNAQGSRKVKRLLLADDFDEMMNVARAQVEGGAHVLDLCCALTERVDEDVQMSALVKRLQQSIEAPLMIDSTEAKVVEMALKANPGRAIINSINLERGRERIEAVCPLAVEHGAALVALTIDETGMAKTRERKLEVAQRIYEICTREYRVPAGALIFDALTFTLATGEQEFRQSAVETMEGIRLIKERLPRALTILGVSNVSFGLSPHARAALNSVFLYHAVQAGLDLAIVNPADLKPYPDVAPLERELCEDVIFDRREDALQRLIAHFEASGPRAGTQDEEGPKPWDDPALPVEQRIHNSILYRRKENIQQKLDEALRERAPIDVLNNVLLPAMKDVGDRFGAGELILPFVLQSAEVMKAAVLHLEQFLEKKEGYTKGRVVIATVFGDVHDIGKNLVGTILSNNGYTVFDLGKQVPIQSILEKAREVKADAIGLSALLVSTSKQMPACVKELATLGLEFPVVVGGAAINRDFGRRILYLDDEATREYAPGVFYAKDAFEGLEIVDQLVDGEQRRSLRERISDEARRARERRATAAVATPSGKTARDHLLVPPVPAAPFWGARTLEEIDLDEVFSCYDLRSLYRLSWGGGNLKGEAWERVLREEFEPRLQAFQAQARRTGFIRPRAAYGLFPAAGEGDAIVVYDPADPTRELMRLTFPRQPGGEHLCLADYLRPAENGRGIDLVGFQVVTVGDGASEASERLQAEHRYSEALFLHGFSVQAAEATAEWLHRRIRRELGLGDGVGQRYSWGYPACPEHAQHAPVFALLQAQERLGVGLTEGFQIMPEQSTAALVLHHPQAKYFDARATRELERV
ncbi:MAG: methionine synthase [bacterium]|nr:methionine synthase [bacterium]